MSEARQCTADCSVNIKQSYADIIHDFAIDIQTSAGNAFVEIPPYNPAILKVIESCKSPAQPILLNQLVFEIGVDDMNRRTFGSPVKIIYD